MTITSEALRDLWHDGQHAGKSFPITIRGEPFEASTNGHALVAIRRNSEVEPIGENAPKRERVESLFAGAYARPSVRVSASALRAWLDPFGSIYELQHYRKCAECGGAGEQECDLGHFHECKNCDGDGVLLFAAADDMTEKRWSRRGPVEARIFGVYLDARLVSHAVTALDGELLDVHAATQDDEVMIVGENGFAIVMPISKYAVPTQPVPRFPEAA